MNFSCFLMFHLSLESTKEAFGLGVNNIQEAREVHFFHCLTP